MVDSNDEDENDPLFSNHQGFTPMSNSKDQRNDEKELLKQRKEALDHPQNQDLWNHPDAPKTPGTPDKIYRPDQALDLEKQQSNVAKAEQETKKSLKEVNTEKKTSSKPKTKK